MNPTATLAVLLEGFFTQRLMNQRQASAHTLRSYRDTFRLLLRFAQQCLNKPPSALAFDEIDAPLITSFLEDLEKSRGITARSRNLRLTAIGSFFRYAAYEEPSRSSQIQRVLAMPSKRYTRSLIHFLDRAEIPEPKHLVRTPRLRLVAGRRANRIAFIRIDRTATQGCATWGRGPRALRRERAKGEMHSTDENNCSCAENLASGAEQT
jgi:site-specific recombinase XerD